MDSFEGAARSDERSGPAPSSRPGDMRGMTACPLAEAKHLWVNAGRWGIVWELTDLRVEEAELSCPWGNN